MQFESSSIFRTVSASKPSKPRNELLTKEIKDAEYLWYRKFRSDVHKEEMKLLSRRKQIQINSKIVKFNPFYNSSDCVIRVGGRLQHSHLLEEVILPHSYLIYELRILQVHRDSAIIDPLTTLAIARQTIWFIQGYHEVKRVIIKICFRFKRQNAVDKLKRMGIVPKERLQHSHAFALVDVDFAGLLYPRINFDGKKSSYAFLLLQHHG